MLIFDPDLNDFRESKYGFNSNSTLPMYGQTGSFGIYVAIGNRQVGIGKIGVIDSGGYPFRSMDLPIYKLVVVDNLTGINGKMEYLVTRDAPVINSKNPKNESTLGKIPIVGPYIGSDTYNIINTAFEPSTPEGNYYLLARGDYPKGTGLTGFALRNITDHTDRLIAIPNESSERTISKNIATEVLIHVGGNYTNKGIKVLAGSFGCFGVYEGNAKIEAFTKDIVRRQDSLKKRKKGHQIHFTISQRPDVKWNWIVDENGKIVG